MREYTYAVITEIPPNTKGGNMATALGQLYMTTDEHRTYENLGMQAINLAIPVFALAEILILDAEDGREIAGRHRKPGKWTVSTEHFQVLEEAVLCAETVMENYIPEPEEATTP